MNRAMLFLRRSKVFSFDESVKKISYFIGIIFEEFMFVMS
jgi:hypothetical protein